MWFLKLGFRSLAIAAFYGFSAHTDPLMAFSGSANFSVAPRFFEDERLGNKKGFRDGFIPEFLIDFGLTELPYRLEPSVGISYIYNQAPNCLVNSSGDCVGKPQSIDKIRYHLLGVSAGLRWRAWDPEFFILTPFVLLAATYRFIHIRRTSFDTKSKKKILGGDFGGEVQLGILCSFFSNPKIRNEMQEAWELKDFGMSLQARYLPAGLFKHGMADILQTGGFGFGGGLYLEW
jgi:hypothetical protein